MHINVLLSKIAKGKTWQNCLILLWKDETEEETWSLIHQDKISQTFLTTIGLKQGDVLSTTLFNIYVNDLPGRLHENSRSSDTINDIPYLDDTKINNLLFADDLEVFSLSKEDLQK